MPGENRNGILKTDLAEQVCRIRGIYQRFFGRPNRGAVVITGNQKTGSTAIGALLARVCGKTFSMDPVYHIKRGVEFELLEKRASLAEVIRRYPRFFAADIIKDLHIVFFIEQAFEFFEGGRFVFIIRDPRDNIRSILNRLKLPGNLEQLSDADFRNIPTRGWREIINGRLYQSAGANYVETMAHRWNRIAATYRGNADRMTLIRYEDFLGDKTAFIKDLAERLGIKAKYDISGSVNIQYQPKGDNSASWPEFFGRENLRIIEQTCGPMMSKFGYALSL